MICIESGFYVNGRTRCASIQPNNSNLITYIKVYQLVSYLKDVKLKSLEMRPFIEEFKASELPERMPDWAKVNGNSDSSDDEFQANTRYAKECGDRLLQKILYQK